MSWSPSSEIGGIASWLRFREISPGHSHVGFEAVPGTGVLFNTEHQQILDFVNMRSSLIAFIQNTAKLSVLGAPAAGEFLAGLDEILTGDTVSVDGSLNVDYAIPDVIGQHGHIVSENVSIAGDTLVSRVGTLRYIPVSGSVRMYNPSLSSYREVTGTPGTLEYNISGKTVTFSTGQVGFVYAHYATEEKILGYHEHVFWEYLSGTGPTFQLANAYIPGTDRLVWFTTGVAVNLNSNVDYTIDSNGLITYTEIDPADFLVAFYLKRLP